MMDQSEREDRDEILIEALAAGLSHAEAAAMVGCSTKTIQRRYADPTFSAEVAKRRAMRHEELAGRLSTLTAQAVGTIAESLTADSPAVRLKAAEMILTWAGRTHSAASIDARLAALEHTQQGPPPSADDTDSEVE